MGILARLFGSPQTEARSAATSWLPSYLGTGIGHGYNDTGMHINERTALAASSVFACVKILAEAVAQLPIHVHQRGEGGKDYQHPVATLLGAEPNEYMTAATFREALLTNLCLYGNAYAYIDRDEFGVPIGLYPLRSDHTQAVRENGDLYYLTRMGDTTATLTQDQVLHVLGFSFDGIVGISPIQQAKQNIGLSIAMERFAAKLFSQGGNVGGILKTPPMNDDAMKTFVSSWRASYTGVDAALKVAVLPDGYDFKQTTVDPDKAQLRDARIHQVLEVARIYRIPPHMLGVLDKASYASIEQQSMDFYQMAVQPLVTRFEQECNRKLLLEREKPTLEVRFNMDAMLRAATGERYAAYAIAITNGIMTRAECRAKEGLPFLPGSDVLLQPLNMTPVGTLPTPTPAPSPKPDPVVARSLVEDVARRFLVKESKALGRALKKHKDDPDGLRSWSTEFYGGHRDHIAKVLASPLRAAGVDADPAAVATRHVEESTRRLGAGITPEELEEWPDVRAAEITDELLNTKE